MGFRHKFAYSFFDFAAYKEFLVQGLGKSILYIFLVTLIFSTLSNIKIIDKFSSELSSMETTFIHNAPNFELKNGTFSIDSNEPIYYKYDGLQLIVDTSGKTSKSVLDSYSDGIYINSKELIFRQKYTTLQTLNFSNFPEINLTKTDIQNDISRITRVRPFAARHIGGTVLPHGRGGLPAVARRIPVRIPEFIIVILQGRTVHISGGPSVVHVITGSEFVF